jgi:hypothetical protein
MAFDPFEHPIIYTLPERLTADSAWIRHIPFAYLAMELLRPRRFVELGAYSGVSYSAFCHAVQILGLETRCTAVDTWSGDAHVGSLGPQILAEFRAFHDARFSSFSSLMQANFESARHSFDDQSVDLLHIDGAHSYEAVRRDFESYLPKMSQRGVVLLHDSADRSEGFGVYRLVEELRARYKCFEFSHASGLAVIQTGSSVPTEFSAFLTAAQEKPESYRALFSRLGEFLQAAMVNSEMVKAQFHQVQTANRVLAQCGLPTDPNSTNLQIALASPLEFAAFAAKQAESIFGLIKVK